MKHPRKSKPFEMTTELSIAEKLIKGCNEIEFFSRFNCDLKCMHYNYEKKFILCDKCQIKIKALKSSCQRFLKFLEGLCKVCLTCNADDIKDKITDLKKAIQKYNGVGI